MAFILPQFHGIINKNILHINMFWEEFINGK